jgi:two-component system response regulator AtoC
MSEKKDPTERDAQKKILVIDDEENMRHLLKTMLVKSGFNVDTAADGQEGYHSVKQEYYDYILCDIKMPNLNGMQFLEKAQEHIQATTVIMMSAYGTIDIAVEAMKRGAYDFISKPFKHEELRLVIRKAEEREYLKNENKRLKQKLSQIASRYTFGSMVAKSKAMQEIFALASKVAQFDTTVLITGESGTGKELIARGIHAGGPRSAGPLVAVNCGGIPETLLESELFGHLRGAFTGADRNKPGLFEEADGGTIFLDEIGELPLSLQVKLLRVLQENEIRPVGAAKTKKIDARVIAATSKKLIAEIEKGLFREDLFYRLNVMPIKIPRLAERSEDIPLLCEHFIDRLNEQLKRSIVGVDPSAMAKLLNYSWPGNVRQLENTIERAMVLAEDDLLKIGNFPPEIDSKDPQKEFKAIFDGYSLKNAQKVLERSLITKALKATGGNRTRAAKMLEISHPSLVAKIKRYEIDL